MQRLFNKISDPVRVAALRKTIATLQRIKGGEKANHLFWAVNCTLVSFPKSQPRT